MAAEIVVEVHRKMFLENKANGAANPTSCPGYLQTTAKEIIARCGVDPDDRARLEAYFSSDQTVRNLVNTKLNLTEAGERRR